MKAFGDAFIAHVRADHADWPYGDVAVRNYAEATQRLSDATERLERVGAVEVHPVTPDRIADLLAFFDRDAFAGNPPWAACYCTEPHLVSNVAEDDVENRPWQQNREAMAAMLADGRSRGYLAYVDGRPAAWVNASLRSEYALYRDRVDGDAPAAEVIGISCFIVAPPYRRHGLADRLLDTVIADAPSRGAGWIEAYPAKEVRDGDAGNFHGPLSMFTARGFAPVAELQNQTVVRRPA